MNKKKISIITPVLNESENIDICIKKVRNFFKNSKYSYEHIFVDNASTDDTKNILFNRFKKNKNIKLIFNKKNYEILPSIFNSLKYTSGDAILVCYAADNQDPLSYLNNFLSCWENGHDLVSAQRLFRKETFFWFLFKRLYYNIYLLLNKNSKIKKKSHFYVNVFQLIDKSLKNKLINKKGIYPHIPILTYIYSKKISSIKTKWIPRKRGYTKNNFKKLFLEALFTIYTFTYINILNTIISLLGIVFSLYFNYGLLFTFFLIIMILTNLTSIIIKNRFSKNNFKCIFYK